jgi:vacuolar-type H+-ATPase subunit I/STV1
MAIEQSVEQERGGSGFVAFWTLAILLGLALVFAGRFFGYANNQAHVVLPQLPLFTGILSVIIILLGYSVFARGSSTQRTMGRRTGTEMMAMGAFMLAGHFVFKMAMPYICG